MVGRVEHYLATESHLHHNTNASQLVQYCYQY